MQRIFVAVAILFTIFQVSEAICPNKCSGHGTCGSSDKCTCEPGFVYPDCSGRQCAFGLSWLPSFDTKSRSVPLGNGMGGHHEYTECSSKGRCDRSSGLCTCYPGYRGKGCRRQECPGDGVECSGHGICRYAGSLVPGYNSFRNDIFKSQRWDAQKTRLCLCDRGWSGSDCSERLCPKGDDPLTDCNNVAQSEHVQKITITSMDAGYGPDGFIALKFQDMYGGNYTTETIRVSGNYYPQTSITNMIGDKCNNANTPCYSQTTNSHSATINPMHQFQYPGAGHSFFDADNIRKALQKLPNFAIPSVNVTEQIDVLEYMDSSGDTKFYYTTHSSADCGSARGGTPNGVQCGQSIFYVTFTDSATSGEQKLLECLVPSTTETLGREESNSRQCAAAQPRLSEVTYTKNSENFKHQLLCTVEAVPLSSGQQYEEHEECSERGLCDSTTGICGCYEGHSGEDCSKQTIFF